jgi:hypothetical protein
MTWMDAFCYLAIAPLALLFFAGIGWMLSCLKDGQRRSQKERQAWRDRFLD